MFKVRDERGIVFVVYGVRTIEDGSTEFLLYNPILGKWVWDEACCYAPLRTWST